MFMCLNLVVNFILGGTSFLLLQRTTPIEMQLLGDFVNTSGAIFNVARMLFEHFICHAQYFTSHSNCNQVAIGHSEYFFVVARDTVKQQAAIPIMNFHAASFEIQATQAVCQTNVFEALLLCPQNHLFPESMLFYVSHHVAFAAAAYVARDGNGFLVPRPGLKAFYIFSGCLALLVQRRSFSSRSATLLSRQGIMLKNCDRYIDVCFLQAFWNYPTMLVQQQKFIDHQAIVF